MKMKAIVYEKYGSPEVLQLQEIEKPSPKEDEILVKVYATSINIEDLDFLRGRAWSVRILGPLEPKYKILGFDLAGVVEAVGSNIKNFKIGDEVFGDLFNYGFGAFAQYVCVPEKAIMHKPENLTFKQAASISSRSIIALQGLRDKKKIQPNEKVLINGAGGGVGSFAVQIAKYYKAEVTAVDITKKLDKLSSIGADHVIDYTKVDFTKNGERYDLILDIAGYHSIFDYKRALTTKGSYFIVGGSRSTIFQALFVGFVISILGSRKMGLMAWKPNKKEDLAFILKLIESEKLVPIIDRCYTLDEITKALKYFEEGNPFGKIVITIEHNNEN